MVLNFNFSIEIKMLRNNLDTDTESIVMSYLPYYFQLRIRHPSVVEDIEKWFDNATDRQLEDLFTDLTTRHQFLQKEYEEYYDIAHELIEEEDLNPDDIQDVMEELFWENYGDMDIQVVLKELVVPIIKQNLDYIETLPIPEQLYFFYILEKWGYNSFS